ncbi:uncharacterized protein SPPG_01881 [Spizellomyces punctatus DAOM BR117]|uniref:Casein kinase II subunit beta n=1 Tax=Spizellomyces punctatus (strain DAOM BR117) TaxID=645134 RepID=A0A0L0HPA6_SPIPD|nr:uncharacterized protein SPPG_01881 [Spizellomyces punctatus DAOM BR117]KND02800.1 hypothetical protein SPPG_01881 [Spizellomyces punctatus DAOM BR117]|eukprot:XP_016610839.1 hypothetical protein SPPG_01881 [Spizellomyces punctatus DAOM BR117]
MNSAEAARSPSSDSDEEEEEYSDSSGTGSSVISWISWFCSLPGHEFFAEVPDDFVEDDFNLTGLPSNVSYYNEALDLILDLEPEDTTHAPQMTVVESSAELLYGLIHARYILTKQGLQAMGDKYQNDLFGHCPRVLCGGCSVLPCGRSDQPGIDTVKMLCPRCGDLYHPKEPKYQNIDGAFFGTTFANMLFLNYPDLVPPVITRPPRASTISRRSPRDGDDSETEDPAYDDNDFLDDDEDDEYDDDQVAPLSNYRIYTPKIFGFRVSERSRVGPRMRWLRWKEGISTEGPEWGNGLVQRDGNRGGGGGTNSQTVEEDGRVDWKERSVQ